MFALQLGASRSRRCRVVDLSSELVALVPCETMMTCLTWFIADLTGTALDRRLNCRSCGTCGPALSQPELKSAAGAQRLMCANVSSFRDTTFPRP